jgi:hypothetical protein
MFEKLKEKLGGFKKALGSVLESKEKEAIKSEPVKVETTSVEPTRAQVKVESSRTINT